MTKQKLPYTKNERRHPKGGRFFPITNTISGLLDEIKAKQNELGIESEYILSNKDGSWIRKDIYEQRLRRLCLRAGMDITNNHAFRMSLNSNIFIPKNIPVTQRAYLLGHSVETNERFYSHMRTESLADIKNILDGDNIFTDDTAAKCSNNGQFQVTHAHSCSKIVNFPVKQNTATP